MQRSCVILFAAVLLITSAGSEQSLQKKLFNFIKFTGLLKSPYTLPLKILVRGELLSTLVTAIIDFEDYSDSQLEHLPISKIKGRLLTPDEGCGFSKVTNTKITGGQEAKKGAWPWMALLGYRTSFFRSEFLCGGSLITSRHVLTAAHCIDHELKFVRLGEHDIRTRSDGPNQDVNFVRKEIHDYNRFDSRNDIAILYIECDVWFTEYIRPICLPVTEPHRSASFVDTNPFVSGWGRLSENGTKSPVLHQVQMPVLETSVCKDAYNRKGRLTSLNHFSAGAICAGLSDSGKDSCIGDSGGPLMLPLYENGTFPFYQIGIVSYGYGCGKVSAVYTNVAFYANWILEKLNI